MARHLKGAKAAFDKYNDEEVSLPEADQSDAENTLVSKRKKGPRSHNTATQERKEARKERKEARKERIAREQEKSRRKRKEREEQRQNPRRSPVNPVNAQGLLSPSELEPPPNSDFNSDSNSEISDLELP
jgi:hypothetical protein